MSNAIISFFKRKTPQSVKWEEVRREILETAVNMKVRFDITPFYYKVTSHGKTWYWRLEDGMFDGTSWNV